MLVLGLDWGREGRRVDRPVGGHPETPAGVLLPMEHGARATFFLNGHNRGNIHTSPDVVQRTLAEGHQLGGWFHLDIWLVYVGAWTGLG
jgi:hypothetical protein